LLCGFPSRGGLTYGLAPGLRRLLAASSSAAFLAASAAFLAASSAAAFSSRLDTASITLPKSPFLSGFSGFASLFMIKFPFYSNLSTPIADWVVLRSIVGD
jgi:hypothetical protein